MNSSWEAAFTWRESETARLHRDPPAPSWVGSTAAEQPERDTDGVDGARWPPRALTNQIILYSHEPSSNTQGILLLSLKRLQEGCWGQPPPWKSPCTRPLRLAGCSSRSEHSCTYSYGRSRS